MAERIVMDASAMVDYLVDSPLASLVADRIKASEINVPAHFDAEVLSALGRLQRADELTKTEVEQRIGLTAQAPFQCHLLAGLLNGAWALRHNVRLVDAPYIELAEQLDARVITTDPGMASVSMSADYIEIQ